MRRALLLLATIALPALAASPAWSNSTRFTPRARDRTTWDSVFSDSQATRGQATYHRTCARCHMESLSGADQSPALTGSAFMSNWNGATLAELHERVRTTMPSDTPGMYGRQQITDVIAYVLRSNGFPAGTQELTHENDALKAVRFVSSKP